MQGFDPIKRDFTATCKHNLAHKKDRVFTITSTTGPVNICNECADVILGVIWGGKVTGRDKFGNIIVKE